MRRLGSHSRGVGDLRAPCRTQRVQTLRRPQEVAASCAGWHCRVFALRAPVAASSPLRVVASIFSRRPF
eukprot:1040785-Pyramimonas_sp.AAC.1